MEVADNKVSKKILITGAAGFIGFHLVEKVVKSTNWQIIGLDNINDYYDINLKYARLLECGIKYENIEYNKLVKSEKHSNYQFIKMDLTDKESLFKLIENVQFDYVVNLAAQAGVRYSLINPDAFIQSNVLGFYNLIEAIRNTKIEHFIYASSSSIYGLNSKTPFSTLDNVDHPISLYAASKKSNELFAHTYSYLYNIPMTGLRFFTVYGPWGRPDMAYFNFTNSILKKLPIKVYNNGNLYRDFTYIDDIINGLFRVINSIPSKNPIGTKLNASISLAPYKIFNIGNNNPVPLKEFINILEEIIGNKAVLEFVEMQPGEVFTTHADISPINEELGFVPITSLKVGLGKFYNWYTTYFDKN